MRNANGTQRAILWLFAGIIVVASLSIVQWSGAQSVDFDHLKCYQITSDSLPARTRTVQLNDNISSETCTLTTKATQFCTPAVKCVGNDNLSNCDDSLGDSLSTDYLCYDISCPKEKTGIFVFDQFTEASASLKGGKQLCNPVGSID